MSVAIEKKAKIRLLGESLRAAGLKQTKPRAALLLYLCENHGPFSAKELHVALRSKGLDAVTTYRVLAAFEEAGLVSRCDFGDGIARYEHVKSPGHHHHHVLCVRCRKVEEIEDCGLAPLENKVRNLGYSKVRHVLEFTGVCADCAKASA